MLQPLETAENVPQLVSTSTSSPSAALDAESDNFDDDDDDGLDPEIEEIDVVDTQPSTDLGTFKERLLGHAEAIKDFAGAMEYQAQFNDYRFLQTVEREGARFLRLVQTCREVERQFHSTHGPAPNTWGPAMSGAMFYRARPPPAETDR